MDNSTATVSTMLICNLHAESDVHSAPFHTCVNCLLWRKQTKNSSFILRTTQMPCGTNMWPMIIRFFGKIKSKQPYSKHLWYEADWEGLKTAVLSLMCHWTKSWLKKAHGIGNNGHSSTTYTGIFRTTEVCQKQESVITELKVLDPFWAKTKPAILMPFMTVGRTLLVYVYHCEHRYTIYWSTTSAIPCFTWCDTLASEVCHTDLSLPFLYSQNLFLTTWYKTHAEQFCLY